MKNFVSKLNDRNLQRRRESGFTTYVMYSLLILIIYKIFETYPLIPIKTNFIFVFYIFTQTTNIILFIYFIIYSYSIISKYSISSRIISKSSKYVSLLEIIIEYSLFIIPLISNVVSFILKLLYEDHFDFYFLFFALVYLLLTIYSLYFDLKEKRVKSYYKLHDETGNNSNYDNDMRGIFIYITFFTCIIVSLWNIHSLDIKINKINIIVFSILIYSIPFIIFFLFDLNKKDEFAKILENFEFEIYVKNLNDDEIREKLQKKYMGFLLNDWIIIHKKEIDEFYNHFLAEKVKFSNLKLELKKIDKKKYPIEYKGRLNLIDEDEKKLNKIFTNIFNDKLLNVNYILDNGNLSYYEKNELNGFRVYIEGLMKNNANI